MARKALLRTFILLRVNVLTILWLDKRQTVSLLVFFLFLCCPPCSRELARNFNYAGLGVTRLLAALNSDTDVLLLSM